MKRNHLAMFVIACTASAAFVAMISKNDADTQEYTHKATERQQHDASSRAHIPPPPPPIFEQTAPPSQEALVAQLSARMREQFKDTINDVSVQITFKEFRDSLERQFPGEGDALFATILKNAFPELADSIIALLNKLAGYDEWLANNYLDLSDLDELSAQDRIWEQRILIFGEDVARQIWNEDIALDTQRERNVKSVMSELETAYDMPLTERVQTLQAVVHDNYGLSSAGIAMGTSNVTTQLVFRLESVQRDLREMNPEARQEAINSVRRELGFAEERIPALEAMDQRNNEMWEKGLEYSAERSALIDNYQGDDLETELDLLRLKHFDDRHAYSVKQEEAIGLMRYERPRVYGLN